VNEPPLGASKDALDTPCLCLDLDVLEANIAAMVRTCRQHGVAWRPHAKGHKVPAIARRQIEAGALGVTCAKLGEAEVMAAGGVPDVLVANMVVGPQKLARLVELRRVADPIVCVDHPDQVRPISAAMAAAGLVLRVLIEVDIGLHRVGVPPGEPTLDLARFVAAQPGVELAGIMGYEGHLLTVPDQAEKSRRIAEALGSLVATARLLEAHGMPCEIVSCAGTGSYLHAVQVPGITEIQAGGAIFMDAYYRHLCHVPELGYALTLLTTVVSRPAAERAIIDAGRKAMNIESHPPLVVGREDVRVGRLSAEHGQLELAPSAQDLRIGDRLELIPGYADLTTVLHNQFYCFRNGKLVDVWPLEARGKLA
jgi:D-serine deaminase-like pyridoxal phosphate-dependent protein